MLERAELLCAVAFWGAARAPRAKWCGPARASKVGEVSSVPPSAGRLQFHIPPVTAQASFLGAALHIDWE